MKIIPILLIFTFNFRPFQVLAEDCKPVTNCPNDSYCVPDCGSPDAPLGSGTR